MYESTHRIMAGVNAFLDANSIAAMIKRHLGIIISSKSGSQQADSLLNVTCFIICKVKLLFAPSSPMHLKDGC